MIETNFSILENFLQGKFKSFNLDDFEKRDGKFRKRRKVKRKNDK